MFSGAIQIGLLVFVIGLLLLNLLFFVSNKRLRVAFSACHEELTQALKKAQSLDERDQLTGLYNRPHILQSLANEMARAERRVEVFSVGIIDLDAFRQINDRYGFAVGDQKLKEFSGHVVSELRELDVLGASAETSSAFGRFGGEEFILLLPGTDIEGAQICLARLQERNKADQVEGKDEVELTFSAGITEFVAGEKVESILKRADEALCAAKRAGGNQIVKANGKTA